MPQLQARSGPTREHLGTGATKATEGCLHGQSWFARWAPVIHKGNGHFSTFHSMPGPGT